MPRKRDVEQQQRLQRMLAREQGRPVPETLAAPGPAAETPPEEKSPGKAPGPMGRAVRLAAAPDLPHRSRKATDSNARPLSPILRRRRHRRRMAVAVAVLAALLALAAVTGVLGQAALALGDALDSATLYFDRAGGGWPADTGIADPLHVEPLGNGFVIMDSEDVVVYSAYGKRVRAIQPGYARPCLAVGGNRFAVYNRSGTELRVESRTKTLYTRSTASGILLCAMSANGNLALLTQDERYAAVLEVLDAAQHSLITYSITQDDGVPVALAFAPDNRRLACGAVTAQDGRMQSLVYLMDTAKAELGPCYRADVGSLVLELHWLGGSHVLAVFDTYAALLDGDGRELVRYGYGGAVLQNAAVTGQQTALLLSARGGDTLVSLNASLDVLAAVPVTGQKVCATATSLYVLEAGAVSCYGYDGTQRWRTELGARPQAVLAARRPLLVAAGVVEPVEDAGA